MHSNLDLGPAPGYVSNTESPFHDRAHSARPPSPGVAGMSNLRFALLLTCCACGSLAPPAANAISEDPVARIRGELRAGRLAAADSLASAALTGLEREPSAAVEQKAQVLDLLVEARLKLGHTEEEFLALARRAVALRDSIRSEPAAISRALLTLGQLHRSRAEFRDAVAALERSARVVEGSVGADRVLLARALMGLGGLRVDLGEYEAAGRDLERSIGIYTSLGERSSPDLDRELANVRSVHAILLWRTGDLTAAASSIVDAHAGHARAFGPLHMQTLNDRAVHANILYELGDDEAVVTTCEEVLGGLEGQGHPLARQIRAGAINTLAAAHQSLGDTATARLRYQDARDALTSIFGSDHPHVAATLFNLGDLALDRGAPSEALELQTRALRIRRESLPPGHPDIAESLHSLARAELALGLADSARLHLEQARSLAGRLLVPTHPTLARMLLTQAELEIERSDFAGGASLALVADSLMTEFERSQLPSLSERTALRLLARRPAARDLAIARLTRTGSVERAWGSVIRSRGIALDSFMSRHRHLLASEAPQDSLVLARLRSARARLANLQLRGPGSEELGRYRTAERDATREIEELEAQAGLHGLLERGSAVPSAVDLSEIRRALPPRTALVAFVRYSPQGAPRARSALWGQFSRAGGPGVRAGYGVFVLPGREGEARFLDLGPAAEIERDVTNWYTSVSTFDTHGDAREQERRCRALGRSVRERLVDPWAGAVKSADRVFVVPDGSVNLVSFGALPAAGGSRYLAESRPSFALLSTERDLRRREPARAAEGGLLAFGGVDFDAGLARVAAANPAEGPPAQPGTDVERAGGGLCFEAGRHRFPPLPHSARETDELVGIWEATASTPVRRFSGREATETAFKRYASGYRVLHLATHGFLLRSCRDGREPGAGTGLPADRRRAPVLLSGLAFAGVNAPRTDPPGEDDGVLTAAEIGGLDLRGVECVALSACQTGLGEIRPGEGVFGLRRAFEIAGAESLLLTLWSTEDSATRTWMRAFYEARLAGSLAADDALAEACRNVLRQRRERGLDTHPRSWGAFLLSGH
jgi:CHAT domain-containing protein/tetratricopeptide (TPR) repeat protein